MNRLETIKQTLFSQWSLIRIIRLTIGLFLATQAVQLHDAIAGFFSALLLFQAFTNTGCCGVSGCAVPTAKTSNPTQKVEYEEIGEKK